MSELLRDANGKTVPQFYDRQKGKYMPVSIRNVDRINVADTYVKLDNAGQPYPHQYLDVDGKWYVHRTVTPPQGVSSYPNTISKVIVERLTPEKGDKGDPFRYEDFTPSQLAALKGEPGEPGTSIELSNDLNDDSVDKAITAAKAKELNEKYQLSEKRASGFLNINEYLHLVPNRATAARDQWDWTAALKQLSLDAANQGKFAQLNKERYMVTDSLFSNVNIKNAIHWVGNQSHIVFNNTVTNKPLLDLHPGTTRSTFQNMRFSEVNKGTSIGVRISAFPQIGEPNWKNRFTGCEFYDFKTGVNFTTNGNPLVGTQQDWASENLFLHCKFKNCRLAVLNQNLQSLNNTFLQSDIENDESGETFTFIRDEAGGGMFFYACSLIGRGRVYEWCNPSGATGLFPGGHVNISNCRFEVRGNHVGELFYQDPNGNYNGFNSNSINVTDCKLAVFGQNLDLIKYAGKVNAVFTNVTVTNGSLNVTNVPVEGISATYSGGSLGEVVVKNSNNIKFEMDLDFSGYGTVNYRFAHSVKIEISPDNSGSQIVDSLGFTRHRINTSKGFMPLGVSTSVPNRLVFNDPQATAGFKNLKLIVPKYSYITKFGLYKLPVRISESVVYKLYIVKDADLWVTPQNFNVSTDAILCGELAPNAGIAGLIEAPFNTSSSAIGYELMPELTDIWTEGRIYLEKVGTANNVGGFVFVEYM